MKRIKIELSEKEDAILYEAGRGAENMMEISRKLCCHRQNVRRVLERFEERRVLF